MAPVTWKAMTYLLGVLVLAQAGTLAWTSDQLDDRVTMRQYQSSADDIRWIRECLVTKCWDKP